MNSAEVRAAFASGWKWGRKNRRNVSPREASMMNPKLSGEAVAVWMNGAEDGMKNDRWRLEA